MLAQLPALEKRLSLELVRAEGDRRLDQYCLRKTSENPKNEIVTVIHRPQFTETSFFWATHSRMLLTVPSKQTDLVQLLKKKFDVVELTVAHLNSSQHLEAFCGPPKEGWDEEKEEDEGVRLVPAANARGGLGVVAARGDAVEPPPAQLAALAPRTTPTGLQMPTAVPSLVGLKRGTVAATLVAMWEDKTTEGGERYAPLKLWDLEMFLKSVDANHLDKQRNATSIAALAYLAVRCKHSENTWDCDASKCTLTLTDLRKTYTKVKGGLEVDPTLEAFGQAQAVARARGGNRPPAREDDEVAEVQPQKRPRRRRIVNRTWEEYGEEPNALVG